MMKNRLDIKTLRIFGFEFFDGREHLENLKQNKKRRYPFSGSVSFAIYTSTGTLHVCLAAGFEFDGRSGPKIVDWYVPNLGTLEERMCWLCHDANGYGQDLSFDDTNVLLFAMLRDMCRYRKTKAALVRFAVGLSRSWYGEPKPSEWCYKNRKLVSTLFVENREEK